MIRPTKNIKVKIKLTGSITGKLNGSTIVVEPELENLEVTPSTEEQVFKSEKYGFDEVRVNGITADIDEDIKPENIKAGVNILGVNGSYEGVDTSDATATPNDILVGKTAYSNNEKIEGTIPKYDGAYSGEVAEEVKITNTTYLFYGGNRAEIIDELLKLCKDVTIAKEMFYNNTKSTTIDLTNFDTSKTTSIVSMFYGCSKLTDLNMSTCNLEKVFAVQSMFSGCSSLTNFKSFKNLGKGYTMERNNYLNYTLSLSACNNLTHESLIDVLINGLYDLNLTYDVANGGTLYRQSCVLGATNLAKLQATEEGQQALAEADRKGWNVS